MISSPCLNCPNKDMPKDDCLGQCSMIKAVQGFQKHIKDDIVSHPVDYTEEGSIIMNVSEVSYW